MVERENGLMNIFQRIIEKIYLRIPGNLAYYDQLTHTYNRLYYDRVMKPKYVDYSVIVEFFDIDDLKKVNDSMGHSCGSDLISEIAKKILENKNTIEVARTGGDEFVAIVKMPFEIENASCGFYKKEMYEDLSSAVMKADKKMYSEKQQKRKEENK